MSNTYVNAQSNTGTCTATAAAGGAQTTWNLCSLSVSQAGPTGGANAKLTIYDGGITGTVLFAAFLSGPGIVAGTTNIGSVGVIQDIPLPRDPQGRQGLQATPGNAMTIQVTGTGANQVSINARFSDGLP